MTFARPVRLLVFLVVAAGMTVWLPSLLAQSRTDTRPYDPGFDSPLPGGPGNDRWGEIPAYVSTTSGDARLERDGELTSDFEQVPLLAGDQLRTTRGRVEILYSDGSVLALDEYSTVTIDNENAWRLHTGRVSVVSRNHMFIVDVAPIGVARLRSTGKYRVTVTANRRGNPEVELAVTRGSAELENPLGRTLVREGTRALTTDAYAPSIPYAFAAPRDDFERWTEALDASRYGVESARYLPVELRVYGGDFDRYGDWSRHSTYGWVWSPRVSPGWEPFRSGRWAFVVGFGYNWIGGARWEWPTHYSGRWDRGARGWFWVPSGTVQFRRVGYSTPRRSVTTAVSYYSRTPASLPAFSLRNNTKSRASIADPPHDERRPQSGLTRNTRSATVPSTRSPMTPVYGSRQAPPPRPADAPHATRSDRLPQHSSRPELPGRDRRSSTRPPASTASGPPSTPSVEATPRPSRGGERQPPTAGRLPTPSVWRPPSDSRTPSPSSRPSSGTAVRRGGGSR